MKVVVTSSAHCTKAIKTKDVESGRGGEIGPWSPRARGFIQARERRARRSRASRDGVDGVQQNKVQRVDASALDQDNASA